MGNSGPKIEFQEDSVLPRPQQQSGPRQAAQISAPAAGLPRPQTQASIPVSLTPSHHVVDGLPRPLIPRPKSSPPTRSRSPLPFESEHRGPNMVPGVLESGRRQGHVAHQQRAQTTLLRTRTPSSNQQLMGMWLQLLSQLGSLSTVFVDIQESTNKIQLAALVIDAFAASTLFRYFSCMSKFLITCEKLQLDVATLTAVQLLDIFLIGSKRTGLDPSMTLKALIWFGTHAGVTAFAIASHPLVNSWRHSKVPKDRNESLPLPLYVVVQWERRLLQAGCSLTERLVLGGFLIMIWSGLRFADLQRITHKSLMASYSEIRGLCWRTKTCSRGQPWGLLASGFLSNGDFSWSMQFLQQWDYTFSTHPCDDTDFLIPSCSRDGPIVPLQAMSYVEALGWFRQWLPIPWRKSSLCADIDTLSYSIHGMKATFLSWGSQLGHKGLVTDEMRRLQGHHKPSQSSISLYSRDDVGGQLELHRRLIEQVKGGWRPITPQHRGGQAPCKEPTVEVELFKKAMPSYNWKLIHFYSNATQTSEVFHAGSEQAAVDSSSESDSSSDSSSDGSWSEVETTPTTLDGAIALGHHRNTIHAMIKNDKPIKNGAQFLETPLKTGCGLTFTQDRISILELSAPMDGKTACNHRGCNKLIASLF